MPLILKGFPGGSAVKNPPAKAGDVGSSGDEEIPLEKEMATHSRILAWRIHGQRSLAGYSPWRHRESDTTYLLNNKLSPKQSMESMNTPWAVYRALVFSTALEPDRLELPE